MVDILYNIYMSLLQVNVVKSTTMTRVQQQYDKEVGFLLGGTKRDFTTGYLYKSWSPGVRG